MAVEEKSENGQENFVARPLSDWKEHRTVAESSVMRFCCSIYVVVLHISDAKKHVRTASSSSFELKQ